MSPAGSSAGITIVEALSRAWALPYPTPGGIQGRWSCPGGPGPHLPGPLVPISRALRRWGWGLTASWQPGHGDLDVYTPWHLGNKEGTLTSLGMQGLLSSLCGSLPHPVIMCLRPISAKF